MLSSVSRLSKAQVPKLTLGSLLNPNPVKRPKNLKVIQGSSLDNNSPNRRRPNTSLSID